MAKKRDVMPVPFANDAQNELSVLIATDPQYSTEPDPTGKLGLSDEQKAFLKAYTDFKSVPLASQLAHIDEKTGQTYFLDPICRNEIRRINLAMYYRKFSKRLLTIDEIGGYLTSMLIDEDVAEVEKLESKDKLAVAKLIIDLNKLKAESFNHPKIFDNVEYSEVVKDLSPDELKRLIDETTKPSKAQDQIAATKAELISKISESGYLDPSEIAYLNSCTIEELQKLIKDVEDMKQ